MKAKRRVCALLFSALMIWQGFMIVNAAGASENTTATLGSGTTVDNGTTMQGGSGSGRGPTAPEAPSEAPAAPSEAPAAPSEAPAAPSEAPTAPNEVSATAVAEAVQSQHQGTLVNGIIQDAHIYSDENKTVELKDGQTIDRNKILQFKAQLNFQKTTLHKGDFTEIQLPSLLQFDSSDFEITGAEDKPVAKVEYYEDKDKNKNIIRITFNENIENRKNESGEIFFRMKMNPAKESGEYALDIKDGEKPLISRQVIYKAGYEEPSKTFFKDTVKKDKKVIQKITVNGVDHYLIRYQVTFDAAYFEPGGNSYDELEFIDEFGENLSLFAPTTVEPQLTGIDKEWYTPKIQRGVWKTITEENGFEYWSLTLNFLKF